MGHWDLVVLTHRTIAKILTTEIPKEKCISLHLVLTNREHFAKGWDNYQYTILMGHWYLVFLIQRTISKTLTSGMPGEKCTLEELISLYLVLTRNILQSVETISIHNPDGSLISSFHWKKYSQITLFSRKSLFFSTTKKPIKLKRMVYKHHCTMYSANKILWHIDFEVLPKGICMCIHLYHHGVWLTSLPFNMHNHWILDY